MWAPLGHGLAHDSQSAGQVTTCDQSEVEAVAVAAGAEVVATHTAAEDVAGGAEAEMADHESAADTDVAPKAADESATAAVEDGCHMPSSCARESSVRRDRERERRIDEEEECFILGDGRRYLVGEQLNGAVL